jgi:hypothetical protein
MLYVMLNPLASTIIIVPILLNGILLPEQERLLFLNSVGCVNPVGIKMYPYAKPIGNVLKLFTGLFVYPLLNKLVSPLVIVAPLNLPQYIFEASGFGEGDGVGEAPGHDTVGVCVGVLVGVLVGV